MLDSEFLQVDTSALKARGRALCTLYGGHAGAVEEAIDALDATVGSKRTLPGLSPAQHLLARLLQSEGVNVSVGLARRAEALKRFQKLLRGGDFDYCVSNEAVGPVDTSVSSIFRAQAAVARTCGTAVAAQLPLPPVRLAFPLPFPSLPPPPPAAAPAPSRFAPAAAVVDVALPAALFGCTQRAFAPGSPYWSAHGYRTVPLSSPFFSHVVTLSNEARVGEVPQRKPSAVDVDAASGGGGGELAQGEGGGGARGAEVGDVMSSLAKRLQVLAATVVPAASKAVYAEVWAHCRPHANGHQLHYDSADEGRGDRAVHPIATAVWFGGCGAAHDAVAAERDAADLREAVASGPSRSASPAGLGKRRAAAVGDEGRALLMAAGGESGVGVGVYRRKNYANRSRTPPPVGGATLLVAHRSINAVALEGDVELTLPMPRTGTRGGCGEGDEGGDGGCRVIRVHDASILRRTPKLKRLRGREVVGAAERDGPGGAAAVGSIPPWQRGLLVPPRINRAIVFEGALLHGVMAGVGASPAVGERRVTVMVAFWRAEDYAALRRGCGGTGGEHGAGGEGGKGVGRPLKRKRRGSGVGATASRDSGCVSSVGGEGVPASSACVFCDGRPPPAPSAGMLWRSLSMAAPHPTRVCESCRWRSIFADASLADPSVLPAIIGAPVLQGTAAGCERVFDDVDAVGEVDPKPPSVKLSSGGKSVQSRRGSVARAVAVDELDDLPPHGSTFQI